MKSKGSSKHHQTLSSRGWGLGTRLSHPTQPLSHSPLLCYKHQKVSQRPARVGLKCAGITEPHSELGVREGGGSVILSATPITHMHHINIFMAPSLTSSSPSTHCLLHPASLLFPSSPSLFLFLLSLLSSPFSSSPSSSYLPTHLSLVPLLTTFPSFSLLLLPPYTPLLTTLPSFSLLLLPPYTPFLTTLTPCPSSPSSFPPIPSSSYLTLSFCVLTPPLLAAPPPNGMESDILPPLPTNLPLHHQQRTPPRTP